MQRRANGPPTTAGQGAGMPNTDLTHPAVIDPRFAGLPDLAHGGYVGGLLAATLASESAEVRLRRPIPTATQLELATAPGGDRVELRDGDAVIAEGRATRLELDVPEAPSLAQAAAATRRFAGHVHHPFPDCYVCGTGRRTGDGLRLFPGAVDGRPLVAAPWIPPGGWGGPAAVEQVWAAFDCAQLWALLMHQPGEPGERAVTASLAGTVLQPVRAGEMHIVFAWPLGREGRSLRAGAAVVNGKGELCAAGVQAAAVAQWGVPLDLHAARPVPA
jgi:hypothetical protein